MRITRLALGVFLAALVAPLFAQTRAVETKMVAESKHKEPGVENREEEIKIEKKVVFVDDSGEVIELTGEGDGSSFDWSYDGRSLDLGGDGPRVFIARLGLGRGYLGAELTSLSDALRRHFGVPEGVGVMIAEVAKDSPAEIHGLEVGDIVTSANGEPIRSPRDLTRVVRTKDKGERLDLDLFRDRRPLAFAVTLGELDRPLVRLGREGSRLRLEQLGDGVGEGAVVNIDDAVARLRDYFESDEWKARLDRFESKDWTSIEDRMAEVQRQLEALQRRIEELDSRE